MAATSDANFFMLAAPAALSEKLSTTSINEGVRYSKFRTSPIACYRRRIGTAQMCATAPNLESGVRFYRNVLPMSSSSASNRQTGRMESGMSR
ncbi:hypothetical protein HJB89_11820 [Rhizobium sp. NZLR8]|uniref:hypothetical protein n=1 Tax=Rhizobium sp. NZLR8 TaxID=2731104 RepID=UPI001C837BC5|nr:hypothetical protein [Rhizobium sp. NZLR8]MBX5157806.1 hypothetical protein [Rhizobium sp. NZLR8]